MVMSKRPVRQANELPFGTGKATTRACHLHSKIVTLSIECSTTTTPQNSRLRSVRASASMRQALPQAERTRLRSGYKIRLSSTKIKNLVITDKRLGMFSTLPSGLPDIIFGMALHSTTANRGAHPGHLEQGRSRETVLHYRP
ncbi:hypothetical protein DOTSEDRAFT_74870 [Dothistroma septosporum NZE10]|uniref:Uncharacterized protein n=1 Tax=Dothistroma septosporum (strain NZE10 / CBS 128990) TaxID=675120 RepID=N1PF50_DOTSN|nr:hypothetical protein DOTSEDRAFT_74870 [Dothistroma septosporum NZE10]